jgi:glycosyltransferase involved in cell wall biosynthesis
MEIFLTFLIITYRRPEKVARLLNSFLDDRWQQVVDLKFEIVIADDHSEDKTGSLIQPIIQALQSKGWSVRYVYRNTNLRGDRNLYYGYTRDSKGKFVWFLCDDDVINIEEAISYLKVVYQTNPLISICGFTQGANNEISNDFGGEARLITDFTEAVDCLIKFPKTTAYLMRRTHGIDLDLIFPRWDNTLASWIGYSIYILCNKKEGSLLIYPSIVATADDDYSHLNYSFRVFRNFYIVTKDSIELSGKHFEEIRPNLKYLKGEDEIILNLTGLLAHYSRNNPIRYTRDVYKKELKFIKKNWYLIFFSKYRIVKILKYIFTQVQNKFLAVFAKIV